MHAAHNSASVYVWQTVCALQSWGEDESAALLWDVYMYDLHGYRMASMKGDLEDVWFENFIAVTEMMYGR